MKLSPAQLAEFKRDGVLTLPGFFAQTEVERWRRQVLAYFEHPSSGDDWRAALRRRKADDFHPAPDPTPLDHPGLADLYGSLHGSTPWVGENELLVRPGDERAAWIGPRAPHIDYPIAVPVTTFANVIFYLTDVTERGAAFMYWPGSHHVAWRHHRRHPDDYLARGARSQDQTFTLLAKEMPCEPVEFTGRAGDLLLWHSFTFHSASINARPETRLAIIGRWGEPRTGHAPWDFNADIWSAWRLRQTAPSEAS